MLLARISRLRIRKLGLAEGGSGNEVLVVGREGKDVGPRALKILDM